MKQILICSCLAMTLIAACKPKESKKIRQDNTSPVVNSTGTRINFPQQESARFFQTEKISSTSLMADVTAPAKVSATILTSQEGASGNIVLFDNPELSGTYSQLLQHLTMINQIQNVNVRQRKTELARIKDLQEHGAATGKDLLESETALAMEETNLITERSAIIEQEAKLKAGGFEPKQLRSARAGTAYVICDIPESEVEKVKKGSECKIQFASFPNENITGRIDDITDMVDQVTRMVKLRVSVNNASGKLKAGMFGTVAFGVSEGKALSVNKDALVTIQGRNYAFIKAGPRGFERREVNIGDQIGDRIVVFSGLKDGEEVVTKGVMQLKGLSFGY